ncbi:hypothetical protein CERSUDRAFT_115690 [Gelatoporia subvermispora B]|uniref:Peptidase S54 rhomboid domain-containing protein n=1 Tax=Ceriporiopsis subvermispora (strain B) TaxID=914234 RepID=M2PI02_CERS8|nr:hypothetical protein CERSUDRAFT_115690 [Gelatoporia subvermispora B]
MPAQTTRLVIRPTLIVLTSMLGVYTFAAYKTNQNTDSYLSRYPLNTNTGYWIISNAYEARQSYEFDKITQRRQQWMRKMDNVFPPAIACRIVTIYTDAADYWKDIQDTDRALATIGILATAIIASRLFPRSFPRVLRSLFHHPFSGRSVTLLTSAFNHLSSSHLVGNLSGLWFAGVGYQWLSQDCPPVNLSIEEANSCYHLLAFTFASGSFSMLCNHLYEVALYRSRVRLFGPTSLATLTFKTGWQVTPTCGISGVIYAVVAVALLGFGDDKARLPLGQEIPAWMLSIPLLLFETAGLLAKRPFLSMKHVAHIAGFVFGALYVQCGMGTWETARVAVARATGRAMPVKVIYPRSSFDSIQDTQTH